MTRKSKFKKATKENKTMEGKGIFAPFDKYAAIAVLLVGVLVTTAIMVDKRMNSVESQIAELEGEVAKSNGIRLGSDKAMAKPAALDLEKNP